MRTRRTRPSTRRWPAPCRSFRTASATDRGRPVTAEAARDSRRLRAAPLAASALLLLVLAFALRTWVAEPFAIPTESMAPTLRPGDHVLVEKLSYRFGSPRRGDLVVFEAPDGGSLAVKRIVGLGGDRVAMEDGVLAVNGRLQKERYVDESSVDSVYFGPVV